MASFVASSVLSYIFYLLLTTASGSLFLWSKEELIVGGVIALIIGAVTRNMFFKDNLNFLNPRRFFSFVFFVAVHWSWALVIANIDVAKRVITGNINPGILRVSTDTKNDFAISIVSTALTLTPGTITVDVDEDSNDLYVHWIGVNEGALKKMPRDSSWVCGNFAPWAKRITE